MRILTDGGQNSIIVDGNNIHLKLKGENRKRLVGRMNKAKRILEVKRKRGKHLHYTSNSYGFNYHILSNAKLFDKILLSDEHGEYAIPVEAILDDGKFLFFKQQGFEKQIFMTLSQMDKFKRKPAL